MCDPIVLKRLAANPADLFALGPRQFEETAAGVLKRLGYAVRLGPEGSDGDVHLYAHRSRVTGLEHLVVQCPRFARYREVVAPVMKLLRIDNGEPRAGGGLAIATSFFTPIALEFVMLRKYQLAATNVESITRWMDRIAGRGA